MALDALGMRVLAGALGRAAPFGRLLLLRIATEALHVTMPAGFVVADSTTAVWFDASFRIPLSQGAAIMLGRKWLVTRAHAAYIALGAAAGTAVLARMSERLLGGRSLPWLAGALALVPLTLSLALGTAFRTSVLARAHGPLARIRWRGLAERVERWRASAASLGSNMTRIGAAHGATWRATALFFGCWVFESIETALIVALAGGRFDLPLALAVETAVSLLRSMGNVAPAGLGLQDVGYATLLPATGLPLETAAAFVLLKRGKDIAWIAVGYALFALMRREQLGINRWQKLPNGIRWPSSFPGTTRTDMPTA
jgi:hypothetical protein